MHTLLGTVSLSVSFGLAVFAASLNVAMFADTMQGHVLVLLCAMSVLLDILKLVASYLAGDAMSKRNWRAGLAISLFAVVLCVWSAMTTSSAWRTLSSGAHEAKQLSNAKTKLSRAEGERDKLPDARPTGALRAEISQLEAEHLAGRVDCAAMAAVRRSCGVLSKLRSEMETAKERDRLLQDIRDAQAEVDKLTEVKTKQDFVADAIRPLGIAEWSGWLVAVIVELVCLGASALSAYAFACRHTHGTAIGAAIGTHMAQPLAQPLARVSVPTEIPGGTRVGTRAAVDLAHVPTAPMERVSDTLAAVRAALAQCAPDTDGWRTVPLRAFPVSVGTARRALAKMALSGEVQLDVTGRVTRVKLVSKPQLQVVRT